MSYRIPIRSDTVCCNRNYGITAIIAHTSKKNQLESALFTQYAQKMKQMRAHLCLSLSCSSFFPWTTIGVDDIKQSSRLNSFYFNKKSLFFTLLSVGRLVFFSWFSMRQLFVGVGNCLFYCLVTILTGLRCHI